MLVPDPMKQGKMGRKRQTESNSVPASRRKSPTPCAVQAPCLSCLGACYLFWLPLPLLQPLASAAHSSLKLPHRLQTCLWNAFTWGCLIGLSGWPWSTPLQWAVTFTASRGTWETFFLLTPLCLSQMSFQRWPLSVDNVPNFPWEDTGNVRNLIVLRNINQLLGNCKRKGVFLSVLQPGRLPGYATCSVRILRLEAPCSWFYSLHLKLALHNTEKNSKICADNLKFWFFFT